MNVLDIFSGAAGGWSLGLERAGFITVAACEIDPWRREHYSRNFPHVRMYGDIRELTGERLNADGIGPIHVLAGSPPCQDASTANTKGRGIDGERTGLFWEALRLVREVRPRWVLLENVPGLRTRGYDRIHDALEGAGYAVRPLVVGAWHAGAPHRRNRVWIVANTKRESVTEQVGVWEQPGRSRGARRCDTPQPTLSVADASESITVGRSAAGRRRGWQETLAQWTHWNSGPPDLERMDDGIPKGMARAALAAYGDAVVPILPEIIGRAIMRLEHDKT